MIIYFLNLIILLLSYNVKFIDNVIQLTNYIINKVKVKLWRQCVLCIDLNQGKLFNLMGYLNL
ncbi:hypothetical protein SAMN02583745_01685 [Thorsellia anophelis DSM 18579]|uniref:Uncharacterized protein n=1 Tax=Thorsellia anophelis DSM 18579 TaxID=1123402 RepID=A0A1I0CNY5_9GAMM|nr:hypothetical protein SAMN02583745_01685 [Thorsellia anophelis DSM 18579]